MTVAAFLPLVARAGPAREPSHHVRRPFPSPPGHLRSPRMPTPFLTAEWRSLAMLNYEIDPAALAPFVPAGTELDQWQGKTYVSMVGFMFLNTRVMGISIPFHANFEEVNLRFYVRRQAPDGTRRGVVFIKETRPPRRHRLDRPHLLQRKLRRPPHRPPLAHVRQRRYRGYLQLVIRRQGKSAASFDQR